MPLSASSLPPPPPTPLVPSAEDAKKIQEDVKTSRARLQAFVNEAPKVTYSFDSSPTERVSFCCRAPGAGPPGSGASGTGEGVADAVTGQQTCVRLGLNQREMFESMQSLGFFCQVPSNPHLTHLECRRI
ncbi:hypothetical protein BJ684DRAFT_8006 [Piptocephalis cylindrospora]|uniref:Uncharacterized protein n=1 Tax=Piptocephalis cylindrospora TaxID=1907219 RepID=A0A4P9Y7N1_9FUNG|nr:hypothetical protein BJ684DRAFT_8006 [Piptocephalis cylindrospora]|eukprot:RKP14802.1 hypothetical protein BJ684DRAFT_8006 [Piptocephalis cylindrospora]